MLAPKYNLDLTPRQRRVLPMLAAYRETTAQGLITVAIDALILAEAEHDRMAAGIMAIADQAEAAEGQERIFA